MFIDENEVRHALKSRPAHSGTAAWPGIVRRIETSRRRQLARRSAVVLAVALVIVVFAVWRPARTSESVPEVRVLRAETLGRPADVLVLQPDEKTVLIVLQ